MHERDISRPSIIANEREKENGGKKSIISKQFVQELSTKIYSYTNNFIEDRSNRRLCHEDGRMRKQVSKGKKAYVLQIKLRSKKNKKKQKNKSYSRFR